MSSPFLTPVNQGRVILSLFITISPFPGLGSVFFVYICFLNICFKTVSLTVYRTIQHDSREQSHCRCHGGFGIGVWWWQGVSSRGVLGRQAVGFGGTSRTADWAEAEEVGLAGRQREQLLLLCNQEDELPLFPMQGHIEQSIGRSSWGQWCYLSESSPAFLNETRRNVLTQEELWVRTDVGNYHLLLQLSASLHLALPHP